MDQTQNVSRPAGGKSGWLENIPSIILGFILAFFLFIVLFALNYFNILHVYRFIPGFSYLPQYIPPKTAPFVHDTQTAQTQLGAFLQKNVNPTILANSPNAYTTNGIITERNWTVKKDNFPVTFDARLYSEIASNNVRYIRVFASLLVPVEQKNLQNTLESYFNVSLPAILPCITDNAFHSTYCQQLTRIGNIRQIVGAKFAQDQSSASAQTNLLYFCQIYPNVPDNQYVSCTNIP